MMKTLKEIFQALLGAVAIVCRTLIAAGRLVLNRIRGWWKRRAKWFRRTVAATLILFAAVFVTLAAFVWYDCEYGRCRWDDERLSENVQAHKYYDGKYRVYNISTGGYTTPKINWISETALNDSLAVYAIPNQRGFLNTNTGEIVIDAATNDYSGAWAFSEGLAAVMKDGKIGFINARNEVVIPFQYDYSWKCDVNMMYLFHQGYCTMADRDGNCGLVDTTGQWVVEPEYDKIMVPQDNGYRIVIDDGRFGLLGPSVAFAYPPEYELISFATDGSGIVLTKDGRKWQVDWEGNVVNAFMFDSSYWLNYPSGYSETGDIAYTFAPYAKYQIRERYGIMNRFTGKPVTDALYDDVNMLAPDLFEVLDPYTQRWYLVDSTGSKVCR